MGDGWTKSQPTHCCPTPAPLGGGGFHETPIRCYEKEVATIFNIEPPFVPIALPWYKSHNVPHNTLYKDIPIWIIANVSATCF